MTLYLGIDQSYGGFGLARLYRTHADISVVRFTAAKYGKGIDRLKQVENWLQKQFELLHEDPLHIAMEGYSRGSKNRREEAGELAAVVKRVIRNFFPAPVCYPTIISPGKLKLFATGNGKATKEEVITAVQERWNVVCEDDNAADAYVLARMAERLHRGVYNFDDQIHEIRALRDVVPHTERMT